MKKRIDSVESKRGDQPGNRNALKTGRLAVREADAVIAEMRGDPAQGKSAS